MVGANRLGDHVTGTVTLAAAGLNVARAAMQRSDYAFPGKTAIAGVGQTEFSKDSGRSEMRLAVEAIAAALADAGLEPKDVDGYCNFTMDNNPAIEINRYLGGGDLTFFSRIHYGGGAACATVLQAALAVHERASPTRSCAIAP